MRSLTETLLDILLPKKLFSAYMLDLIYNNKNRKWVYLCVNSK